MDRIYHVTDQRHRKFRTKFPKISEQMIISTIAVALMWLLFKTNQGGISQSSEGFYFAVY